jgi:hypothetical protein
MHLLFFFSPKTLEVCTLKALPYFHGEIGNPGLTASQWTICSRDLVVDQPETPVSEREEHATRMAAK